MHKILCKFTSQLIKIRADMNLLVTMLLYEMQKLKRYFFGNKKKIDRHPIVRTLNFNRHCKLFIQTRAEMRKIHDTKHQLTIFYSEIIKQ
jgi:hypothetical protein